MVFSRRCRLIIQLFLACVLAGCIRGQKKSAEEIAESGAGTHESSASFRVGPVSGDSQIQSRNALWDTPEARAFRFEVCLEDRAAGQRLLGQPVTISNSDRSWSIERWTHPKTGCVVWTETLAYNYFLINSYYVKLDRWISGRSDLHRGSQIVHICVSPWLADRSDPAHHVLDCDYQTVPDRLPVVNESPQAFGGWAKDQKPSDAMLWFSSIKVETLHEKVTADGRTYSLRVTIQPAIVARKPDGGRSDMAITRGEFQLWPVLRETHSEFGKDVGYVLSKTRAPISSRKVDNGVLAFEFDLDVPVMCQLGFLDLGLKLIPKNGPVGLQDFDAPFRLGGCQDSLGTKLADIEPKVRDQWIDEINSKNFAEFGHFHRPFDIQTWVQDKSQMALNGTANQILPNMHYRVQQFRYKPLTVKYDHVVPGETTTERTLQFTVWTCVADDASGHDLRSVQLQVYRMDENGQREAEPLNKKFNDGKPYVTGNDSCFSWTDQISHQYYVKEHYFRRAYDLVYGEHGESGAPLVAVINPWDYGFTFGRDITVAGGETAVHLEELETKTKPPSKMIIYGYHYETLAFHYDIDDFLNLKVKKNVLLKLEPRVLRTHSIIAGRVMNNEPLRDGIYLLRTAIQKIYPDHGDVEREFIDTYQGPIRVQSGVIVTPITFTMQDLRLMRIRSNMLIEIIPIDEKQCRLQLSSDDLQNSEKLESQYDYTAPLHCPQKDALTQAILDPTVTGLKPRTFVGPIIPLSNSFSASTRPTDNLEETQCAADDTECLKIEQQQRLAENEMKKSIQPDFDKYRQYFNSIFSINNVSVSDLFNRKKQIDDNIKSQDAYNGQFSVIAKESNLEYLQLNNLDLLPYRFPGNALNEINRALPLTSMPQEFIDQLTSLPIKILLYGPYLGPLREQTLKRIQERDPQLTGLLPDDMDKKILPTIQDLQQLVDRGAFSQTLALHLCAYWFTNLYPQSMFRPSETFYTSALDLRWFILGCRRELIYHGTSAVFAMDQRLKVTQLNDAVFRRGLSVNLQLNANMNISNSTDIQRSAQLNFFLPFVEKIMDYVHFFDASVSFQHATSNSLSSGRTANASTSLVVQTAKFNLTLSSYERCTTLRLRPNFLNKVEFFDRLHPDVRRSGENIITTIATRGMMICSGLVEHDPLTLRENYYFIAQNFAEGDMNDQGNILNQPWLLQLRGVSEYSKLMRLLVNHIDLNHELLQLRARLDDPTSAPPLAQNASELAEPGGYILENGLEKKDFHDRPIQQRAAHVRDEAAERRLEILNDQEQLRRRWNLERQRIDQWWSSGHEGDFDPIKAARDLSDLNEQTKKSVQSVTGHLYGFSKAEANFLASGDDEPQSNGVFDLSHLQANHGIHLVLSDPHLEDIYSVWDWSVKKIADLYSGTTPAFPGFITLVPESFDTAGEF